MKTVILRRKPGHLTMIAMITVSAIAAIFFFLGFFLREMTTEPEPEIGTLCMNLSCVAPVPKNPKKKGKVWEERICATQQECNALMSACLKHVFRDDLFVPGSSCVIQQDPICQPINSFDARKFPIEAIDLIGGRWKKPPKKISSE